MDDNQQNTKIKDKSISYVYSYLNPLKPGKYIYGKFSFGNEPFLIGKGTKARCRRHLLDAKKGKFDRTNPLKSYVIKQILESGKEPIIVKIQERITNVSACLLEIELIQMIGRKDKKMGPLCNLTDGGEGLRNPTDEERKVRSENMMGEKNRMYGMSGEKSPAYGNHHTEEYKKNMSIQQTERMKDPNIRSKLEGENNPAKRPEVKQKLKDNFSKKRDAILAGILKYNEQMKGVPRTEEDIEKISKATKEAMHRKEVREKVLDGLHNMSKEKRDHIINRIIECNSSLWKVIHVNSGKVEIVKNLNEFCKQNNLPHQSVYATYYRKKVFRGITVEKL